jgi:hypothetical protein
MMWAGNGSRRGSPAILLALLICAVLLGCGQEEADVPPLAGPSGFALSVNMEADPAFLNADGASTSTVTITVRDPNGRPLAGQALFVRHDGDGVLFPGSQYLGNLQTGISLATDGSGVATVVYRAGTTRDVLVTIQCEPYTADAGFAGQIPRSVVIHQR